MESSNLVNFMKYNDFLGPETSQIEYKICAMYFNKDYTHDEALRLLKDGIWSFNSQIDHTLKSYLEKYLGKYIASFSNKMTISNDMFGSLYIGVDDKGYIKGIPYDGELDINTLRKIVDDIFERNLIFSNNNLKEKVKSSVRLNLFNVSYNKNEIIVEEDLYQTYLKMINKQKILEDNYNKVVCFWNKIMLDQNRKLTDMFPNDHTNFRRSRYFDRYVKPNRYRHKYSHLEIYCDVPSYYDILADMKTKTFNPVNDKLMSEFSKIKPGGTSDLTVFEYPRTLIFKTYARYKDYNIEIFRKYKVKRPPRIRENKRLPQFLLSQCHKMLPKWLINNNLNLYLIRIDIPLSILENGEVQYFNEKKRKYEGCYREESKHGPVTIFS